MNKLLLAIILLIAVSTQASDTTKFYKIVDFGKPTQIKYECTVVNGDTTCKEMGSGKVQGLSDSTKIEISAEEKEVLTYIVEIEKIETEMTKKQKDKEALITIVQYLSQRYKIDIQELIKRVSK